MPIELKRESLQINEVLCNEKHSSETYTYIIVPDSKPDIKKVLLADANAVVKEKYIQKDKITVSGILNYKILYLGDDEEESVRSIYYDTPFSQAVSVPGLREDASASVLAEATNVICNIENSRKLSVQTNVCLDCNILNKNNIDFVTEVDSDKVVPYKTEMVESFNTVVTQYDEIEIGDTVSIGQGMSEIYEVLKADATLSGKDTKVVNNKLIVKGIINLSAIYLDVNKNLQVLNGDVPFTEIVDVNGISDELISDISYKVESLDVSVCEDNDGDRTILDFDMVMGINISSYESQQMEVISDLYSPEADINIHTTEALICTLAGNDTFNLDIKDTVSIGVDAPEISSVYSVNAIPEIERVYASEGKLVLEGNVKVNAQYISNDDNYPVCEVEKKIPFEKPTDIVVDAEGIEPYVNISIEDISYSASKSHEIDVRINATISARAIKKEEVNVISKIDVDEDINEDYLMPSIVIYFVESGDTLWNIAKRYRTTVEDIADANDIDEDSMLMPGQKLLIPKRD